MRLIVAKTVCSSLLHQEFIRKYDQKAQEKPSIKEWESLPVDLSVYKGPLDAEDFFEHRDRWTPDSTATNQRNKAHRCSGPVFCFFMLMGR
jgi:hypothetical protein